MTVFINQLWELVGRHLFIYLFIYFLEISGHQNGLVTNIEYLLLCSTEEIKSYSFVTTLGVVRKQTS